MVKAGLHWKIIIPYLVTPIVSLLLFFVPYFKIIEIGEIPDNNVLIPIGIFGVLGFWLILVFITKSKTIVLTEQSLTIRRIFLFRSYKYQKDDILSYSISNHFNFRLNWKYQILQFTTKDAKVHSVVSYELIHFKKILGWVKETKTKCIKQSSYSFLYKEYSFAFIAGMAIVLILLIGLKI